MNTPLKILTVANVPPDPNSGAAGTVWHTNVALRELGHTVDEIWADQLGPPKIKHGNLHALLEQPRAYRREVIKAVAKVDYDVVIMDQPQAYLAAKALKKRRFQGQIVNRSHGIELRAYEVVSAWHRRLGVPENTFLRSFLSPVLRQLQRRQWPILINNIDQFLVSTTLDRDYLKEKLDVDESNIITLAQGMSKTYFETPQLPMNQERMKHLIYVGQAAFIKGGHILTKVITKLMQHHDKVRFTALTTPEGASFFKAKTPSQFHNRLSFPGWMNEKELIATFDHHGIFLFPSFYEGFGKAPFEAMSRGLCVVASDEGGMHDLIHSGQNGYLAKVGDVEHFFNNVNDLLADFPAATKISKNALSTTQTMTWQNYAKRFVESMMKECD